MPVEVILPKVDMDMTHGTLAVWHVAAGDEVAKGAPLFDIETDKAAMEVESPASGRLHAISAQPGDRVAVGTVVALIYAESEEIDTVAPVMTVAAAPAATAPATVAEGPQPTEVILPKVDMDMTHGTLAVWHSAAGDEVTKGAALFDIETDKAAMEVESPASGILHHILAKPGDKVPVGEIVAYIYPAGVPVGPRPNFQPVQMAAESEAPIEPAGPTAVAPRMTEDRPVVGDTKVRATPAARVAAVKAGLDLASITGSGPHGRIQRDDVRAYADRHSEVAAALSTPLHWTPEPGPLHVSIRKGSGVPLVMLHGFTADSQSWAPLEKAMGPGRALIRIDLPGHGRSPKRRIRSFAELARMVVETFDDATRSYDCVHVLGHSLGGALALSLADIRARQVASLALIAPAGLGPEIDAAALGGIVRASRAESLAPWLRRLTATPAGISEDYAKAAMKLRSAPGLRAVQADMAENLFPDGVQPFDLRPALSRLACPTVVIWGRGDHILPIRQGLSVEGDFALHLLSGAGHVPQIECPDRVAQILVRHQADALVAPK